MPGTWASRATWAPPVPSCAFLCSVHAGYVNGQNVLMGGGSHQGTF